MEYAIIGLLLLGIGILVYSFYKEKDQAVQLEEKMENLSIQILKEIHQIQSTLVPQGNNKLGENRRSKESLKEKKEGA
ncbi:MULTISPECIES: hypothetical protein [Aneurinibacillus]|uniref:Uncharacterized protein n=1 Tax=Aneurinibacillus thermoaerophilus TaxID=143495 RepID=A0A1G7YJJ4_ANETH|nr:MULTISPECIES: hypothetical protein [Aneurinibacillus]AMA73845.1 hypothetical protein ACH33_13915 [Aneurinibacillus sp. XH2]MED0676680.1 hypothetical protein [Aneurinibacillus thermoaerophilus]MED0679332.1 hypothetical protein [Aneurinibacillus thermoaerophilus]MED0738096.1 hypothetical protein [Aneurinibacillus thermoaerophilus]MED0764478.1 hypothetical protein [Aneurinibacillus thermoaerophilus]